MLLEGTVKIDISRFRETPPAGRHTNCEPSVAGRSWKEGARERADDIFFAAGTKRRRIKVRFAPTWQGETIRIPYAFGPFRTIFTEASAYLYSTGILQPISYNAQYHALTRS